jgi:hypothetical protein
MLLKSCSPWRGYVSVSEVIHDARISMMYLKLDQMTVYCKLAHIHESFLSQVAYKIDFLPNVVAKQCLHFLHDCQLSEFKIAAVP